MGDKKEDYDKPSLLERLNDQISELKYTISKLEREKEAAAYTDSWRWRDIEELSEKENGDLPVPRLEIRWHTMGEYHSVAQYNLVLRHYLGEILRYPISSTKNDGGGNNEEHCKKLELPYRDGCHIAHDSATTGLPAFVVHKNKWKKINPKESKQ